MLLANKFGRVEHLVYWIRMCDVDTLQFGKTHSIAHSIVLATEASTLFLTHIFQPRNVSATLVICVNYTNWQLPTCCTRIRCRLRTRANREQKQFLFISVSQFIRSGSLQYIGWWDGDACQSVAIICFASIDFSKSLNSPRFPYWSPINCSFICRMVAKNGVSSPKKAIPKSGEIGRDSEC